MALSRFCVLGRCRSQTSPLRSEVFAVALLAAVSCRAPNHAASTAKLADGEVALTGAQIEQMKIASEPIDEQNVDDTILTSGKVTFDDQHVTHVFSPVSGRVTRIYAQLGDHVKKGAPLALIESPDIGIASSDVGKANADLIATQHEFERQKELFTSNGATSRREVEQAEDNYRKAKAELDRARQKARLLRAGDIDLVTQTYTLRSEIDGEVFSRTIAPGMEIQGQYSGGTSQDLFTIGEIDQVWVLADVYEIDLARVRVGQKVIVTVVSAPGRTFQGKVDWVSGMLDSATHAARVRCLFENTDRALLPEMYTTVRISVDERRALAIRRSSIVRLGEQTFVFVDEGKGADGNTHYQRVPVVLDEGEGSPWLPVTHFEKGQRVVTSGALVLGDALASR